MMDPNEQEKRDRERESISGLASLDKSEEELLKEIYFNSSAPLSLNQTTTISRTIASFSSLLIKISKKADVATKENILMQKKITNLTWGLLILTVALLGLTIFQVYITYNNP